jgi:hypothetical protein
MACLQNLAIRVNANGTSAAPQLHKQGHGLPTSEANSSQYPFCLEADNSSRQANSEPVYQEDSEEEDEDEPNDDSHLPGFDDESQYVDPTLNWLNF